MSQIHSLPMQDYAASTTVVAAVGQSGNLNLGNTNVYSTTNHGGSLPRALTLGFIQLSSQIDVSFEADWTIAVFLDPDALTENAICGDEETGIWVDAGGLCHLKDADTTHITATGVPQNTNEFHIAISNNSSANNPKLYINGTQVSSFNNVLSSTIGIYRLGAADDNNAAWTFNGSMRGWEIYDSVLTQPQIAARYALGITSLVLPTKHMRDLRRGRPTAKRRRKFLG